MLILGALFVFAGYTNDAAHGLAGSEWRLMTIGDTQVPADGDMFVRFEVEGKIAGSAGCNSFFGSYRESGETIRIDPLGTTRKICTEVLMDLETKMLIALQAARTFERRQTELSLFDEHGKTLACFRPADRAHGRKRSGQRHAVSFSLIAGSRHHLGLMKA